MSATGWRTFFTRPLGRHHRVAAATSNRSLGRLDIHHVTVDDTKLSLGPLAVTTASFRPPQTDSSDGYLDDHHVTVDASKFELGHSVVTSASLRSSQTDPWSDGLRG
ncbi:hypothetical protein N7455_011771 [Penicillium solitum]|uniref:uncharacterized protein n=1 Tax=Penicillium solitum TaxID=60172 RepID=UPI0017D2EA87|nr:hypothetical protein HAV15_009164 [Penicillium sp. str. \